MSSVAIAAPSSAPPKKKHPGGRPAGIPNKAKINIRALAGIHGPTALEKLVDLMKNSASEGIQLTAASMILDRAYGKPSQAVAITGADGGPIQHVHLAIPLKEAAQTYLENLKRVPPRAPLALTDESDDTSA